MIDLSKLPPVQFVDTDPERVRAEYVALYEGATGRSLAPGNPERLFVEALVLREVRLRLLIQAVGEQNLVALARAAALEHLAAFTDVERLPAFAARCLQRFGIQEPRPHAVTIPVGTRVTPDGRLHFRTLAPAQIPAGQTSVETTVECAVAGSAGNGYLAGQIGRLVDPVPYVVSTANTSESVGGAEVESEDSLRQRAILSPEALSVAGPDGAYAYWARTAHQDIADVSVRSPSGGVVEVRPLLKGGVIPGQALLDAVATVLTPRQIRPLTDHVQVLAPEAVAYGGTATYWISRANELVADTIQAAVAKAGQAYVAWQRERLGRDIVPSRLTAMLMAAGAWRVEISGLEHAPIEPWQLASLSGLELLYGGLEDE